MPKYCISGLTIKITAPQWALHENLKYFLCDTGKTDIEINIIFKSYTFMPSEKIKLIVKTPGTSIYEGEGAIYKLYGDQSDIPFCVIASCDWSSCTLYVNPEYGDPSSEDIAQSVREGLLVELRAIFKAVLPHHKGLMIHSCSIIYNNQAILFSAPSGTGKTTHTDMWKQFYGVEILDGDNTAVRIIDGKPVAFGLPWCGTSGQFLNKSVPLGAIIFLQQAKENKIEKLDFQEAFLRLTARSFLLPWNDPMTNQFLDIIQEIAGKTNCYLLNCLPDKNAVETVKECLDRN